MERHIGWRILCVRRCSRCIVSAGVSRHLPVRVQSERIWNGWGTHPSLCKQVSDSAYPHLPVTIPHTKKKKEFGRIREGWRAAEITFRQGSKTLFTRGLGI